MMLFWYNITHMKSFLSLSVFLLSLAFLTGCGERASSKEASGVADAPAAKPEVVKEAPAETPEAAATRVAAEAKAQAEALRIKAEAEAKAAAEVKAAAEKAEREKAEAKAEARAAEEKVEREKAEAKAEAKAKEDYERAEKLRLERKADEAENRKMMATKTYRLVYADATDVAERFNTTWQGDFGEKWKVVKVAQAFPEANAVMVTAPAPIVEACDKIVKEIDVEPKQVYIEARFVELANNASHKLGIDWQMLDGMRGSLSLDAGVNKRKMDGVSGFDSKTGTYTIDTTKAPGSSTANLSHINGTIGISELFVTLRALESSEDARVFSNPKIIVASGKKATVDMTTKYPNIKISAKRTSSGGGADSLDLDMQMAAIPGEDKMMFAKEAFFSWGISLDVTPRVGTNGVISVEIVPTISDRTDWASTGTSGEDSNDESMSISAKYPVLNVQRLITTFNMSSGTTAVIGGLSRTIETQKDNGIPWLRDLWWIGPKVFGSKVRVKEQKEIIVFVTVGLVEPTAIAKDAGLPKNAVLGRQYTEDIRREPGDRRRFRTEGIDSLDLRSLEEQYSDPRRTNRIARAAWRKQMEELPMPFTQDPNYQKPTETNTTEKETK